jgi:hypothetical protein
MANPVQRVAPLPGHDGYSHAFYAHRLRKIAVSADLTINDRRLLQEIADFMVAAGKSSVADGETNG